MWSHCQPLKGSWLAQRPSLTSPRASRRPPRTPVTVTKPHLQLQRLRALPRGVGCQRGGVGPHRLRQPPVTSRGGAVGGGSGGWCRRSAAQRDTLLASVLRARERRGVLLHRAHALVPHACRTRSRFPHSSGSISLSPRASHADSRWVAGSVIAQGFVQHPKARAGRRARGSRGAAPP